MASRAAAVAGITEDQCINLLNEQLQNIRSNAPLTRLSNPLPGGRSIEPFGPTYRQLIMNCRRMRPIIDIIYNEILSMTQPTPPTLAPASPGAPQAPPGIAANAPTAPAAAYAHVAPATASAATTITAAQCETLLMEQTHNIANLRPLARLRNPLPGGRSIKPFGQRYNQIMADCIRIDPNNQSRHETLLTLRRLQTQVAANDATINSLDDSFIRVRTRSSPSITDSPIGNTDEYLQECTSKFHNLPAPFTSLGNKFVKICNNLINKNQCSTKSAAALQTKLVDIYVFQNPPPRVQLIHIRDVVKGQELKVLLRACLDIPPRSLGFTFKQKLHQFFIRYKVPLGGDFAPGTGPIRSFMQTAANQVFSSGFFKQAEEGSSRVIINKNVNLVPLGLENSQREAVFQIIGTFFAFLMLNGIKYDMHLNHYIQARMLFEKQKIKDDAIIMYYLLAFPADRTSRVSLLKNPDHIDGLMFDFNDEVMLDPSRNEEPLSRANFTDHLKLLAKKKLEIDETEPLLEKFLQGFFVSRQMMRSKKVNMFALDILMTGSDVSDEHIEEIITKVSRPYKERRIPIPQYVKWFFMILRDHDGEGTRFPKNVALEQPARYAQSPTEFKRQLLFWWTGTLYYNESLNYSVTLGGGVGDYFRAHTCFSSMDFPAHMPSIKHMYEQLLRQVCETEFTMY